MAHSTEPRKPGKPRPDFPLFAHSCGYWAKKIRGDLHYFGRWSDDPIGKAAERRWEEQKADLLAGRTPRSQRRGLTVARLCNHYIAAKEQQRDAGDIRSKTFNEYFATCQLVVDAFGRRRLVDDLAADDFVALRGKLAKRFGAHGLSREVQQARMIFKYGYDAGLLDRPVRFGPTFKRPSKRVMRKQRHEYEQRHGQRMFEAPEIRKLYYAAKQPVKTMILLAINCAFGNTDCGRLPVRALDLNGGWVTFPRPKTAFRRRCPLWPETVAGLREALAQRPTAQHQEHHGLVFITSRGQPWAKDAPDNPVTKEFRKLLDKLGLHRPNLGFYGLRHSFETIGGESYDQVAVDYIMGHAPDSDDMASEYRERISDERLQRVVDHIHRWLWPRPTVEKESGV